MNLNESMLTETLKLNERNIDLIFKNKIKKFYYFIVSTNKINFYYLQNKTIDSFLISEIKRKIQNINEIGYIKLRNWYLNKYMHLIFPYYKQSDELEITKRNILTYIGMNIEK